jgi:carbonic anhydrase/acetyltransferase-like protein (isoleucine patch superfamily)
MNAGFIRTPAGVYVARTATIVGDVTIGEDSSVWFGAVVRGDVAPVRIGRRVNVQDLVVIHCDSGVANEIEDDVTIGHSAIVHGSFVGAGSLIGMGAKLLGGTRVGRECLIAAGAVLSPGFVVPDGKVVMGVPGRVVRDVTEKDRQYMRWLPPHYAKLAAEHARGGFAGFGDAAGASSGAAG